MSGIFGYINMDGRPSAYEAIQRMAGRMNHWGPDGINILRHNNAAFGHALSAITQESRFEKMPCLDKDAGILFTATARLDNREELCDEFNILAAERPTISDGRLLFRAYRKWGEDSCRHLFGDWSFAAWHPEGRRLFLARDQLGNTGLFYCFKPPLFVFASNIGTILDHPEAPREIDEMRLARYLGVDMHDQSRSRTFWKDICCLPSAHTANIRGKKITVGNYWRIEEASPVHFNTHQEYLEGFLYHFRRAVRVRLNSVRPVGTTLSAGLDSGAVTALAAEALHRDNRPLVSYTSVPLHPSERLYPNSLTDEWPLAHQVANCYENIDHIPIRTDDITPLMGIKRSLEITQTPQYAVANMAWIHSIFKDARRRDLGVMLTGQLGNGGVSWSGGKNYIFYLFAGNQWQKGWQALALWKKWHGYSWFQTVKSQLLAPVLLPLRDEYSRLSPSRVGSGLPDSFISDDFIRRLGMGKSGKPSLNRYGIIDPQKERILALIRNGTVVGPLWHAIGAFHHMDVRDPTADVRLLEYCMGVPDEQDTKDGGQRMLIRHAMAGILPDSVRWNRVRGKQAADLILRLIDQRGDVDRQLDRLMSSAEVAGYIDIAAMKSAWTTLSASPFSIAHPDAAGFLRAFNAAYFLLAAAEEKRRMHSGDAKR